MLNVLITQPQNKTRLVDAFRAEGVNIVSHFNKYVDLIIPTVDEELWFFSRFVQNGTRVMVSNPTTVDLCRDKAEFHRTCLRHGMPTISTLQENLIAKPRFGKGSRGIIRIDRSFVVQPIIEGPEISIDYFADWEGNLLSFIPRYRKEVSQGESKAMELVSGVDFSDIKRFGSELCLIGHNVIQGFIKDGQFLVSEINCRFGGGSWLTFSIFNSPKWLINHL